MSVTAVPLRPIAKGSVAKLWIGLLLLALAAGAMAWIGTANQQVLTTASGLRYRVIKEGTGPKITPADLVALNYVLRKEDGTQIESSKDSGQPFVTGTEGVFPGFAEGLQQMQPGGQYKIWLPPGLHAAGPIPPNAPFTAEDTLVFDIEILQVAPGMAAMQRMMGPPGAGAPPGGAPPAGSLPPGLLPPSAEPPSGPPSR